MALQFKSEQRRQFWGAIAFSLVVEYVVVLIVVQMTYRDNPGNWATAAFFVLLIQVGLLIYKLFSLARRAMWYFWYERDRRSDAILAEFYRLNFPRPDGVYNDADQYLQQVALSPATSPEGAMFASMLLGMLTAHRTNGPWSESLFLGLLIERAMRKMLPWEARTLT